VAIFYCQTNSVSRSSGRSAVAAAAYRSASELLDQRTGLVHDYTRKLGVAETNILLPADAPPLTRNELWNSAESAERRSDSRTAREWIVALPAELNAKQRSALTTEFAQCLVDRFGVGVDVSIHQPDTAGDQRNHHAHLLCTTRQINEHGIGEKSTIELSDSARRKRGLTAVSDEVAAVRKLWADTANLALNHAGHAVQIDQRGLTARGIDREPTTHLGAAATAMERRGQKSDRGNVNRAVQQRNTERRQLTGKLIDLQAERERRQQRERQRKTPDPLAGYRAAAESARQNHNSGPVIIQIAEMKIKVAQRYLTIGKNPNHCGTEITQIAQQIVFKKLAVELEEKAATEKAATEKLAAEKAALEKAALEKAALEKAATEKAATEKAAVAMKATEKAALEKAATEKAALEKAALEKLAAEKAATEKVATEKLAAEKAAAEKVATEKLAAEKAAAELATVNKYTPEELDAVNKYITEREDKRIRGGDVSKHAHYTPGEGKLSFVGVREVNGQPLALVKRGGDVLVIPTDPTTAYRLQKIAVGNSVSIAPNGSIKTSRGRSISR